MNGIKHEYILDGSCIVAEKWVENNVEYMMVFLYDDAGSPIGFLYRTSAYARGTYDAYFYEKNFFGDVIGIYDESGTKVAGYLYNAWGVCTVQTNVGGIATLNPIRYRGYYYDTHTGLYYLQSRYYNPDWGRFISMDDPGVLGASPEALTDKNLYIYCDNNPVMRTDATGDIWETGFDILSLGLSVIDVCINPYDVTAWVGLAADTIDLLPFVTGVGEATRALRMSGKIMDVADDVYDAYRVADNVTDIAQSAKQGWKVGDNIAVATKSGKTPSWNTVRRRYWKNEAHFNSGLYSSSNVNRMKDGLAPLIQKNGQSYSMELHHVLARYEGGANCYSNLLKVSPWAHVKIHKFLY